MKDLSKKELRSIEGGNIYPDPIDVILFFLGGGRYWV